VHNASLRSVTKRETHKATEGDLLTTIRVWAPVDGAALGSLGGQEAVGSEAEGSRGSSRTPRDSWLA